MTIPTVNVGDIVKVVNNGPKKLHLQWDSRHYDLDPGGTEWMPFECAKVYFGDPRAISVMQTLRDQRGQVAWLPDRASEVRRLRLLWFPMMFGEYSTDNFIDDEIDPWDRTRMPHVEIFTVKGEQIPTVFDDPKGNTVIPAKVTESQNAQLLDLVQRQGQMIEALMGRLGMDAPPIDSNLPAADQEEAGLLPPDMVYDPKSDEIIERPKEPSDDPVIYDELPEVD
jgi:hypothetical protein